ncbi:hypothetical protein EVA_10456 [gut metagenome]|uniref:Uncharacterized protein n=1 Tax=gut metagenome TaxID=749906 RepID=J9GHQ4_9ZZZZ
MKEYELSLEFWLCSALIDRFIFPFQFFEYEMDDEIWFCRASSTDGELYLLFDGLEKFTDALNVVPGLALGSCECVHLNAKFLVWKKSELPFSPVWSLEYVRAKLPLHL